MGSACRGIVEKTASLYLQILLFKKLRTILSNESIVPFSDRKSFEIWTRGMRDGIKK